MPLRALARASGLSDTAVKAILSGDRARVRRASAEAVAAVSLHRIYTEQSAGHLPRVGAVRRVQALMAMGWSHHDLAVAGAPNTAGLLASSGHLVTVGRWRQVRDVYDRLSMTPGPSPQTRGWARALGYAPPLAWDEDTIDDPTATAHGMVNAGPDPEDLDIVAVERTIDAVSTGVALSAGEQRKVVQLVASPVPQMLRSRAGSASWTARFCGCGNATASSADGLKRRGRSGNWSGLDRQRKHTPVPARPRWTPRRAPRKPGVRGCVAERAPHRPGAGCLPAGRVRPRRAAMALAVRAGPRRAAGDARSRRATTAVESGSAVPGWLR